ncbi:hypothetical protein LC612_39265 [Nostoc sp. CHAB 5834]|nr:hypothetical protein [Nostoc sp. CHAB 5834]
MFRPEDVLEGARSIRPYLPELLGQQDAEKVDKELSNLLAQASAGEKVDDQVLELLKIYKATRDWLAEFLSKKQVSKGFQPLPGSGDAISASKYVCPEGDFVWYRRSIGVSIPICPTHGALILSEES